MQQQGISRRRFLAGSALLLGSAYAARFGKVSAEAEASSLGKWNMAGPAPQVFIHYLPWFAVQKSATDPTVVWTAWKRSFPPAIHDPANRRPDGLRDIASIYYPLIGPYSSWSRTVVRYHLKTAKAAGATGFILDWNGPGTDSDKYIQGLLDEAHALGMKIAIMYEEKSNFVWPDYRDIKSRDQVVPNVVSDLQYLIDHYLHQPAYLTRNGAPLVLQFNGSGNGPIGPNYLTPAEWEQVMARLSQRIDYGRQGLDPAYSKSAACRYMWWDLVIPSDLSFNPEARQLVDKGGAEFFIAMMCPGFNDTGVWGWGGGPRITPREGLSLFKDTFDHAFVDGPELIQVVTWNDFNEGTVVEPTREFGFHYLDALATWLAVRAGRTADLDAIRAPFIEYVKTCSSEERTELPTSPYHTFLKKEPLDVSIPHYMDALKRQAGS